MKTKGKVTNLDILIGYIVILAMVLVGSFTDFALSSAVYNEQNLFGIFFCAYGERPMDLCFTFAGTLFCVCSSEKKSTRIVDKILGVVLIALGMGASLYIPNMYFARSGMEGMTRSVAVVAVLLHTLVIYSVWKLAKGTDHKRAVKVAVTVLAVVVLTVLLVNVVKIPWSRPRMRLISVVPAIDFQPWWHIGYPLRDHYVGLGISSDEFKSFPSGHTACASNLLLFTLLPFVNDRLYKYQKTFFYGSILFTLTVAFSRIMMGAHFLTDVAFGFLVGFTLFVIALKRMDKKTDSHDTILPLEQGYNVRELGGYDTKDGGKTAYRHFLRADDCGQFSDKDIQFLLNYGVRTVIDLRSEPEVQQSPDKFAAVDEVAYYNIPYLGRDLTDFSQVNLEDLKKGLATMYTYILKGEELTKEIFEVIANAGDACILFHCSAGKDRTGVLAMLLLSLAGVSREDCIENYAPSFQNLLRKPGYAEQVEQAKKQGLEGMLDSKPEYMAEVYDWLMENYGSTKDYLLRCGVEETNLEKVIGKLLR